VSVGVAEAAGEFAVGDGFSVWDFAQWCHTELWNAVPAGARGRSNVPVSGEIGAELSCVFRKRAKNLMPRGSRRRGRLAFTELDAAQAGFVGGE